MKLLVVCAFLVASVLADDARPIYEYPEWWVGRDFSPLQLLGTKNIRGSRIIGGTEASRHQFPYQVGLRMTIRETGNIGLCGGSLISTTRVLTAAHCVDFASSVVTVFGAHVLNQADEPNQVRRTTGEEGLIWHENYNPRTLTNDVAVIRLPTPVAPVANIIAIIALPSGADLNDNFAGQTATASGWGRFGAENVASEFLRFVNVDVITNLACRLRFPTIIQDSTICTSGDGTRGACNGDSGGPLTLQRQGQSMLIGVASFVSGAGCESGFPTGFARVTSFVNWINNQL